MVGCVEFESIRASKTLSGAAQSTPPLLALDNLRPARNPPHTRRCAVADLLVYAASVSRISSADGLEAAIAAAAPRGEQEEP